MSFLETMKLKTRLLLLYSTNTTSTITYIIITKISLTVTNVIKGQKVRYHTTTTPTNKTCYLTFVKM